jgi:AcrR family transcriptional regulator
MGRRNEHTKDQQREMAVAAAEAILVREGHAGLSMRKVADAIGYTVGNLYLQFKNQDDLLATINERTTDALYAYLTAAIAPLGNPQERVRALARAYIGFAQQHPHRFFLMFEHHLPEDMLPRPAAETRIRRVFELVGSTVAPLLPQAGEAELHLAATALWSGVHGVCMLALTGKLKWSGLQHFEPLSDLLVDTFIAGLMAS